MPEERKLVTVLFADVTGSTALGDDLDPEDVRTLMGRYYEHAREVIARHGGTLEKFIGDAVMAVFGLPVAHGDDAERAAAAALALQRAVEDDSILGGVQLRIGVNTGEVMATSDSSTGDFLVTGDAVNVAARLQQHAQPGQVLVSERTQMATRFAFDFGEVQDVEVKGKREPVRVYPLHERRRARQVERPPLVGRRRELQQLSMLGSWALEERRPQLISLVAPAGTGKTRLLEEFLAGLDPDDGWQVAVARCPPYGQTLTYWPLRGLLEGLIGRIDREAIAGAFMRGGMLGADAERLADLLLATLGMEREDEREKTRDRESIFNAWRLLVEALAREAPRVVVFEDLHWASDSLLDLVEHIMQPRTQAALILIGITRPELLDRRPAWGSGGRESFTALVLRPLTEDQTVELVTRLSADLPESIRRRIVERSGGNPFFATELVRGLAERGVGRAVDVEVVPDTVHAAVLARLDLLSPVERKVLQAASVGGRAFQPPTLQAVLDDLGTQEVDRALDGLLSRDLIVPEDGGSFTFRHILIRDVAYGTLSRAERIRMHGAVAVWLERYAGERLDEFVELIAYHYREAVALSRRSALALALPFDPARAVQFLERAGAQARRIGATLEARHYLESAIAIADESEHGRLYEALGDAATFGDAAIEAYGKALRRWRDGGSTDPSIGARLLRKLLLIHLRWHGSLTSRPEIDELAVMRTEALRLAEMSGDEAELWRVKVAELFLPFWRDAITPEEVAEGRRVGLAAADFFEGREEWDFVHAALDGYGAIAMMEGDHAESLSANSRRIAVPVVSQMERADAVAMAAQGHLDLGDFDRSMAVVREELNRRRPGEPVLVGGAAGFAAIAACLTGRWDEAGQFFTVLHEYWQEIGSPDDAGFLIHGCFAALHVALAREDRSLAASSSAALDRLLSPRTRLNRRALLEGYLQDDPEPQRVTPAESWWWGPSPSAIFHIMFLNDRGISLPSDTLAVVLPAGRAARIAHLSETLAAAEAISLQDAARLRKAIGELDALGLRPHAARSRIVLAQMTGEAEPLAEARPVLQPLGDRWAIKRLDEVAERMG